ncbi:hypothetical protein AYI68_g4409 [Smittium mucronatum]|uniref:Uncharacterized protein n=1 Tax=Smittium mucronatum TaxID=133383 RepID=A0A1R0GX61_9FUNG|nr:hypothetical protein AYI68_g4409 [Smittium mucronatum]
MVIISGENFYPEENEEVERLAQIDFDGVWNRIYSTSSHWQIKSPGLSSYGKAICKFLQENININNKSSGNRFGIGVAKRIPLNTADKNPGFHRLTPIH